MVVFIAVWWGNKERRKDAPAVRQDHPLALGALPPSPGGTGEPLFKKVEAAA
jgi:hypothetical protein